MQRYDTSGNKIGSQSQVNTRTQGGQWMPAITALPNGGFVIVWSGHQGVCLQRYDGSGNKLGLESQVNPYTQDNQGDVNYQFPVELSITTFSDSGFVVWRSMGLSGFGGIYGKRFNSNGTVVMPGSTMACFSDLSLTSPSITENQPIGSFVGSLNATGSPFVLSPEFKLISGTGDKDNRYFQIQGSQLLTAQVLNYEVLSTTSVRIQVPSCLYPVTRVFTIPIQDEPEAPTDIILTPSRVEEARPVGERVGQLKGIDEDKNESLRYFLAEGEKNNSLFSVTGDQLLTASVFNRSIASEYIIRVNVTDKDGLSYEQDIPITITSPSKPLFKRKYSSKPIGTFGSNQIQIQKDLSPEEGVEMVTIQLDPHLREHREEILRLRAELEEVRGQLNEQNRAGQPQSNWKKGFFS